MKTLIATLLSMMLTVSFSISAGSQGHEMKDGQDGQMMGAMGDNHVRSMMMDQIAEDPEMRQEMMNKMMQSMDMHQMMSDPEMKSRMQKHIDMMQIMLDSEGTDPVEMQEMMKMHMMCVQAAEGGMMEEYPKENGKQHAH